MKSLYIFGMAVLLLLSSVKGWGQASDLFISEYGEGSSGNSKYIEIYNGTGATVNLSSYEIWIVSNGGTWPEATVTFSPATLADGATWVIANNPTDVPGADQYSGTISFNGDDAIGIAKNSSLLDAVGEDGPDPGAGWDVAGVSNGTRDNRLIRKSTVCDPNTDWDDSRGTNSSNSEWIVTPYTTGPANAGHVANCGSGSSCSITDIAVLNPGACNDNGTPSNPNDDYYVADVQVTFSNPPGSGTLDLSGADVVGGNTSDPVGTSPQTISGVQLSADGSDVDITATFSDDTGCTYSETVTGSGINACSGIPIPDNGCPSNNGVATFTFSGSGTITDVNVGVEISHTWRGDLDIEVESPTGTVVQLMDNTNYSSEDNVDVLFDEDASNFMTNNPHSVPDPTYDETVIPDVDFLTDFNGENPNGTWTLRVCDNAGGEVGSILNFEVQVATINCPNIGDLVINEIMYNPSGNEPADEWFEVCNVTGSPIDMNGMVIDDGEDTHTISSSVVVPAGGCISLAASGSACGSPAYTYGTGIQLSNGGDQVRIECGASTIDEVDYDLSGFPGVSNGEAIQLDPTAQNATANNSGSNWCVATTSCGGGDFGTPGTANPSCTPSCSGITFTSIDGPGAATFPSCASMGGAFEFDVNFSNTGGSSFEVVDANTSVVYGTGSSSPIACSVPNSAGGTLNLTIRDVGQNCSDNFTVNAPTCTLTASDDALHVSEIMYSPTTGDDWFEITNTSASPIYVNYWIIDQVTIGSEFVLNSPSLLVIPAGGQFIVAAGGSACGGSDYDDASLNLPNSGPTVIQIEDYTTGVGTGSQLEICDYNVGAPGGFGGGAFPDEIPGVAIGYIQTGGTEYLDNDDGSNWCHQSTVCGSDNGSPGALTSQCCAVEAWFRTKSGQSGDWTGATPSTLWETGPSASGPWEDACRFPQASNSDYIILQSGSYVTLSQDLAVDNVDIQSGATLELSTTTALTVNDGPAGVDLVVNGKLYDRGASGNGIIFNGGNWTLGATAEIEKTNASSVNNLKDNYQGGISGIPATATWRYTYNGDGEVSVSAIDMFYPNLIFSGSHDFVGNNEIFKGSSGACTIKGDLTINSGAIVYHNMGNDITVQGNLNVSGTFSNELLTAGQFAVTGHRLIVQGNITNSGITNFSSGTAASNEGVIQMEGSSISTNGDNLSCNRYNNSAGGNVTLSGGDLIVEETFDFATTGLFVTGGNEVEMQTANTAAFSNAAEADRYVNGHIRWDATSLGATYVFPLGDATTGDFASLNFTGVPGGFQDILGSYSAGAVPVDTDCPAESRTYQWATGAGACQTGTWTFTPNGSTTGFNYTFQDVTNTCSGTFNTYVIDDQLEDPSGTVTGCPNPSGQFNHFSELEFWATNQFLPVEYLYFTAEARGEVAVLDWATATEINNQRFEIERSGDGQRFQQIGQLPGAGTTQEVQTYQWVDDAPLPGVNYYRLRQVDYDGGFEYSAVRAVNFAGQLNIGQPQLVLTPTLAREEIRLESRVPFNKTTEVRIVDMLGRVHRSIALQPDTFSTLIQVSDLPAGAYVLQCQGEALRFVVTK